MGISQTFLALSVMKTIAQKNQPFGVGDAECGLEQIQRYGCIKWRHMQATACEAATLLQMQIGNDQGFVGWHVKCAG